MFLTLQMPTLTDFLHYRQIDVSSIKLLAQAWLPHAQPPQKKAGHRALDDIMESIAELRYYKQLMFSGQDRGNNNNDQ